MNNDYSTMKNKFPRISRISWGAILAGTLTAIVVAFLLNLLGLGIGLTTIDPMTESNPLDGLGTGTIIWWGISNLAALFIGGMVAGRMSGLPANSDGGLHGFLAWSLYLILSLYLLTSSIGSVFNGIASAANAMFSDSTATNIAQALNDAQQNASDQTTYSLENIKEEAFQLINTAERRDILPADASTEVRTTINETRRESRALLNDLNLDENINEFFNELSVELDDDGNLTITGQEGEDIINKEEIKNYLTQNTTLSEAEINGVIQKWETKIDNAIEKAEKYYEKAKAKAIKISDKAADAAGKYSIILFLLFLLGAGAAFAGGAVGSPYQTITEEQNSNQ